MAPFFEKSSFTFQPFQRHPEVPEVLTEDFFMFARLVVFSKQIHPSFGELSLG